MAYAFCQGRRGRRNVEHPRSQGGPRRKGHRARNREPHDLSSSGPSRLAQADAASVSSQTRHRGSNAFKKTAFHMPCGKPGAAAGCQSCSRMKRASVASVHIREYIYLHGAYLHGAASPKDGTSVHPIMPASNTACFPAFLDALPRKFAGQDILLVQGGAPTIALATSCFLAISRLSSCRLTRQNSTRKKISGMKSARKSSRTAPSNPSAPCAPSSGGRSSLSNATLKPSNPSPHSPPSGHSNVEMV